MERRQSHRETRDAHHPVAPSSCRRLYEVLDPNIVNVVRVDSFRVVGWVLPQVRYQRHTALSTFIGAGRARAEGARRGGKFTKDIPVKSYQPYTVVYSIVNTCANW